MARLMTKEELISYYEDNAITAFLWHEQTNHDQAKDIEHLNNWVAHDLRRFAIEIGTVDTPNGQSVKIIDHK
ncbi:MAG: hypothetical protein CMP14_00850 [Rickettsiales bacterium]|nr:hypothetical protein [Rickettsiales bacterium]|tara:strand:- start:1510 stop:1725 length:216 start_codon:yes stop_codon:yes gene_type:complete